MFREKESEILEFKESLGEIESAGETVCGFMNQRGGNLYFGVKNNGIVKGVSSLGQKTLTDISQAIFDNIRPPSVFNINPITKERVMLIEVKVRKSQTPYHTFKNKPYIRVGNTTKIMPQEEYQRRLIRYQHIQSDYSASLLEEATLNDLSTTAIEKLRKLLTQSGRYQLNIAKLSNKQLLKDLLLLRDGKLTVATLVLLGSELGVTKNSFQNSVYRI